MKVYELTVKHVREQQNQGRDSRGEPPITDHELVNVLISMKHWSAAEWLSEQEEAAR